MEPKQQALTFGFSFPTLLGLLPTVVLIIALATVGKKLPLSRFTRTPYSFTFGHHYDRRLSAGFKVYPKVDYGGCSWHEL